jgi:hypothetical protein
MEVSKKNISSLLNTYVLPQWDTAIGGFNLIIREDVIVVHVMIDSDIYDYRENSDIITTESGIEKDIYELVGVKFNVPFDVKFHSYGRPVIQDINRIKQLFR